jgi:5-methylcytosine-specific restriction endonuclease McrA
MPDKKITSKSSELDEYDRRKRQIELAWNEHLEAEHFQTSNIVNRKPWILRHLSIQDNKCAYCLCYMHQDRENENKDDFATIDHIVPFSNEGEDTIENTLASCSHCNSKKGSSTLKDFLKSPERKERLLQVLSGPDRLSVDANSSYYDQKIMSRGVDIFLNGQQKISVDEYCKSEGWIKIGLKKKKDRNGNRMQIKLLGEVKPVLKDIERYLIDYGSSRSINDFFEWLRNRELLK